MIGRNEAAEIWNRLQELETPVLSVYADIDPSNPDNRGGAWRVRVKNALKDIPEIHERTEHRPSLYDEVVALIDEERPEAKTMALFARQNHLGKTFLERIDLKVAVPVVDLVGGRVDARWGEPWIAPLLYALDEYQRAAALHIHGTEWHLYEFFLGEFEEIDGVFAEVDEQDWKELREAADFIRSGRLRAEVTPDLSGSTKDRWAAKSRHWRRKLYQRLVRLVEKALEARGIERLVILGDHAEAAMVASLFTGRYHDMIAAILPNPSDGNDIDPRKLHDLVLPALEAAERREEMRLLDRIREEPGPMGLEAVIDAIQFGRVDVVAVPFRTEAKIWHCPDSGLYGGTRAAAERYCAEPVEVPLADHIFRLAENFGTRVEFVDGEAADRLREEFGGIAAHRRW
ncbi:hypothetical protein SAMN05216257_101239 [Meinhardsimonia xiamenensis]|jgi:hypothetical protein|uniref:Uncharacterized protein n=1 Tax=Meinhardsimonia xiamenensis TaxID=990712 RepID=A0A1G8Y9V6_9RHOB|nr:VLRF1 family aeRF1-type release factor [Meinhardsimonia xiamenensis]PRX37220.1 hypothetical protein LV81_00995 [Meinhardsimonia xiamenensis]SDJ99506.1 hypothetical protein SAMN05216257_101239 [Meinhardsimonia xiamenensis]